MLVVCTKNELILSCWYDTDVESEGATSLTLDALAKVGYVIGEQHQWDFLDYAPDGFPQTFYFNPGNRKY